jgi:ABC-type Fe3+-hydroxamate transport system substrate-binding protein
MSVKKMGEDEKRDPRAKFVELANARVARAIKDLRLIGNLANKKNYEYTDEEARKILKVLDAEIDALRSKFRSKPAVAKKLFEL